MNTLNSSAEISGMLCAERRSCLYHCVTYLEMPDMFESINVA